MNSSLNTYILLIFLLAVLGLSVSTEDADPAQESLSGGLYQTGLSSL